MDAKFKEIGLRCEDSRLEIKSFFLQTLLDWSVALSHFSCFPLHVLLDRCNFGFLFVPS